MFTDKKTIEDLIINLLGRGSVHITNLIKDIYEIRPQTTKQAVYKALRVLKASETTVQTRGEVALSSLWLKKLSEFSQQVQLTYRTGNQPGLDFLSLKNGEKIVYWFKNFEATDKFWAHAFAILSDTTPHSKPIYIYNPHEWFLWARAESEIYLFNQLREEKRKLCVLIGNRDPLDIAAGQCFDGEITKYYASPRPLFKKQNYYVNVFNDFLIEVTLDETLNASIDEFYKKTTVMDEISRKELCEITQRPGKSKFVIYRNERKATAISALFKRIFA